MWQLFDLAYVIPATVAIGYFVGKFLESRLEGDYLINSILISAFIGLVLTIARIKKFIDQQNKKKPKE